MQRDVDDRGTGFFTKGAAYSKRGVLKVLQTLRKLGVFKINYFI